MAEYHKHEIVSGLFVMLAVLVFSLFAFKVGNWDIFAPFRGRVLLCNGYFADVKDLQAGALVKVGGQTVGKVRGMRIVAKSLTRMEVDQLVKYGEQETPGKLQEGMLKQLIEVEFELADANLKLDPRSARLILRQDSPLAPNFLDLDPGAWQANAVPAPLFETAWKEPVNIPTGESTGLNEIVALTKPVIIRLDAILSTLDSKVLTEKNLTAVESALKDLATASEAGRRITEEIDKLLRQELDPTLKKMAGDLSEATGNLRARLDQVQADVQALLKNANGLLVDNRAEVAEISRRLRRATFQAEMAMRKIRTNPAVLLFGDEEADLQAQPADDSWIRHSGRATLYEQRDENNAADR